jgi:hypothetical protein
MPMTSRTFFGGFGQGDGDGVMGAPWSASRLTVSSVQVYHPPAIRVRLLGHPSVIGQVALLLKESRRWQGNSASMR